MIKNNVGHDGCVPVSFLRAWVWECCLCPLCVASRKRISMIVTNHFIKKYAEGVSEEQEEKTAKALKEYRKKVGCGSLKEKQEILDASFPSKAQELEVGCEKEIKHRVHNYANSSRPKEFWDTQEGSDERSARNVMPPSQELKVWAKTHQKELIGLLMKKAEAATLPELEAALKFLEEQEPKGVIRLVNGECVECGYSVRAEANRKPHPRHRTGCSKREK